MVSNKNKKGSNNSDHDYQGSIQVVPMGGESDESSSLLQHRHPTHSTQQPSHTDASSSVETTTTSPLSISDHVKSHWNSYVSIVERRPLVTKSITATFILGGADLCAQGLEHARGVASSLDWPRAARFACFGLFGAPWSHYYFHWLDTCIPPSDQPCSQTTLVKVFIDQFIQAPILLAIMISMLSIMKGQGFQGVENDMHDNFVNALIANCMYEMNDCLLLVM